MSRTALRRSLVFLFVTVVLDMLAFGMAMPVMPRLIEGFVHGDTARAAELFGLFNTLWAAMQFIFMPIVGALSDRFGRRPVLLASITGLGLDWLLLALAPDLTWLLVGRVLSGITSASVATATAYVADLAPAEERSSALGVIMAAFGIGVTLGPAIGGLLGALHPRLPFWTGAACCLANALYGAIVLPESLPRDRRVGFDWLRANPIGSLHSLARHPGLWGLAALKLLTDLAYASLTATFVLFVERRFGWGARGAGLGYTVLGVQLILVQATLPGRLSRRFGERRVMPLALLVGAAGFAVMALVADPRWVYLSTPLLALCTVIQPTMQGLLTRRAHSSAQGRLQGALGSVGGLVGLIGPALFTQTFSYFIRPGPWLVPGAPFLLAALLLLGALPLALREAHPRGDDGATAQ